MKKQAGADVLLFIITIIWGSSFTLVKNVLEHIPSFAYLSLRFIVAFVILAAIFHSKYRLLNRKVLLQGLILGLMMFGGMALQVSGL